jgi:hypothetical protein
MSDSEKQIAENLQVARLAAAEALPAIVERLQEKALTEEDTETLVKVAKAMRDIAAPNKDEKVANLPTVNITIGLDGLVQAQPVLPPVEVVEEVKPEPEALPAPQAELDEAALVFDLAELLGVND